jgi:hypothetical protein
MGLLLVLLNLPLLYHGCDGGTTYYTLGGAVPCMELTYESEGFWPDSARCLSGELWLANLFLILASLWVLSHSLPFARQILASRRFLICLSFVIALTNSFLVAPTVWRYAVWNLDMYFITAVHWLILRDITDDMAANRVDVAIASRIHFLVMLATAYFSIAGIGWLFRRYVTVDGRPWWQWRLGGLLAVMLILGTAIGMLVRLLVLASP